VPEYSEVEKPINWPTAVLVVRPWGGAGLIKLQATTPHSDLRIVFAGELNNPVTLCFVHAIM
jgi:hypothetical protein